MKTISCKENKCCFELKVSDGLVVEKIKIDGGLVVDNKNERCDYAFKATVQGEKHSFFFVELKGGDLQKAISQLESSIFLLPGLHSGFKSKYARAVCTKITPFINSSSQVAVARFKMKHKFDLKWHSINGSYTIKL